MVLLKVLAIFLVLALFGFVWKFQSTTAYPSNPISVTTAGNDEVASSNIHFWLTFRKIEKITFLPPKDGADFNLQRLTSPKCRSGEKSSPTFQLLEAKLGNRQITQPKHYPHSGHSNSDLKNSKYPQRRLPKDDDDLNGDQVKIEEEKCNFV